MSIEKFLITKYEESQKIKFKEFEIDDNRNKIILKKLAEIIDDFNKLGEEIILTGSIAFFLKTQIIYRSFKDIDLLIPNCKTTKLKYLKLFNKKYSIALNTRFETIEKYVKYFLSDHNYYIMSLFSVKDQIQVDLLPIVPENNLHLSVEKDSNIQFKYTLPLKYVDIYYSYDRIRDDIDIDFYDRYINNKGFDN